MSRVTCLTQVHVQAPAAERAIGLSAFSGDCASDPSKLEPRSGFIRKGADPRYRLNYQFGIDRCIWRLGSSECEFLFQADVLFFCVTTSILQVCDVSCFPIAISSWDDKTAGTWKSSVFPSASCHWLNRLGYPIAKFVILLNSENFNDYLRLWLKH